MSKKILDKTLTPVNKFIHYEHSGGIVLFFSVVAAMFLANSPLREGFHHFWERNLEINFSSFSLNYTLHQWVNDGLMAAFFFIVGLELKREIIAGELSTFKKSFLPIMAAIGGMIVPALIYLIFNTGESSAEGWGIPMATDIVFALALMAVVNKHIPAPAKIFLVALAIVDDLGAVLVIAFFYSSELSLINLGMGLMVFALLLIANFLGVRNLYFYAIFGIAGVWLAFLLSGVHATIAGVIVAFAIPGRTVINEKEYANTVHYLLKKFDGEIPENGPFMTNKQHQIIEKIKGSSFSAQTPLQQLEGALHPWVSFLVIPLFALSNAGVYLGENFFQQLLNPVSIGIIVGLIAGKFIGIMSVTWILVKSKIVGLPENSAWQHIVGLSLLAGMGFTMSLFVTNLAFVEESMITQAKYGILVASLISGILGLIILKTSKRTS